MTQAGLASGTLTLRDNPGQDVSGLNRDVTALDGNGVANRFDANQVKERLQLGQAAGYVGMRAAGDIEQAAGMGNGSTGATALHAAVGAAVAALGGGNAMQGALGAGAAEAATPLLESKLSSTGTELGAGLVGALVGGGAGASTALAGDLYNRQLHPDEIAWIKAHAQTYADQQGISVDQATAALSQQAARDTDALWAATMPGNDASAQAFLVTAQGNFTNELGNSQALFTTVGSQYTQPLMYLPDANADRSFFQTYVQPGVTQGAGAGLTQMLGQAGQAVLADPEGAAIHAFVGVANGIAQTVVHPVDTVNGMGQNLAYSGVYGLNSGMVNAQLAAIYGQDVSGAAQAVTQFNGLLTAASAVGVGKLAGGAIDKAVAGSVGKAVASSTVVTATTDAEAGGFSYLNAENYVTQGDEAVFWSGKTDGVGGANVAGQIALAQQGTTLEQLAQARGFNLPVWDPDNPASIKAWDMASKAYAENASGAVTAVIGSSLRPGNVWENFELPALKANLNVTQITQVDPVTGVQTIVFKR
jgi:filamentous hemagglutinin